MYFKSSLRKHPDIGELRHYYRLVESYRNADNRVCHQTILNIGFIEDATPEQLNKIQQILTQRYEHKYPLFEKEETDPIVIRRVEEWWQLIVVSQKMDLDGIEKLDRMVQIDSLKHQDVREVGSEWICKNTWDKLQLTDHLKELGFSEEETALAATQIISRAVYPASEYKTVRWIKENSAVTELTGYEIDKVTKDKLYQSALHLYKVKDSLEQHLSTRTNELFDLKDTIVLYDLTNTYFEGEKRNSNLAKFGRSKEKRSDAKLVVLALVVNTEGFIKYSSVLEGNVADCNTLPTMIEKLRNHTCNNNAVVVLDAGIATDDNLEQIAAKGYRYVCVSRTKLKDYEVLKDRLTTLLETKSGNTVRLKSVVTDKNTDYYLEVMSETKALKENGMLTQFEKRFEESLQKIHNSIQQKNGTKKLDKVHQRIGRAMEKYPSVQQQYTINVSVDKATRLAAGVTWKKDKKKQEIKENNLGIYFLRTNMDIKDEVIIWNIYNTIREIENAFRTLKTDLDLRPIYHKNDDATMAHLHLGLLAYWLVNTIRHQLKNQNINSGWSEIVRIGNTQKVITTSGTNTYDKIISIRKCSEPEEKLATILAALKMKYKPFTKRKSVVHKPELKKQKNQQIRLLQPT
jgi:transposase